VRTVSLAQRIPDDCTLTEATVETLDGAASLTVDGQRSTDATWPTLVSICGGSPVSMATGAQIEHPSTSGWTLTMTPATRSWPS
jgi:hypothetical protein